MSLLTISDLDNGGQLALIFANPLVSHCVFAGDARAYQT